MVSPLHLFTSIASQYVNMVLFKTAFKHTGNKKIVKRKFDFTNWTPSGQIIFKTTKAAFYMHFTICAAASGREGYGFDLFSI